MLALLDICPSFSYNMTTFNHKATKAHTHSLILPLQKMAVAESDEACRAAKCPCLVSIWFRVKD